MLVQFSVENFFSFKNEVCLNMIPSKKSRLMKEHILRDKAGKDISALPLAAVYGANASGKSNLVKALDFFKWFVTTGTPDKKSVIDIAPFRLDPESKSQPSRFEIVFKHKGVLYTYGFVVSERRVQEEWLFAYYSAREVKLFERITRPDGAVEVETGTRLGSKGFIKFVEQGTRPNQLFLKEAYEKNVKDLEPVMEWFQDCLWIIYPESEYRTLEEKAFRDMEFVRRLASFLQAMGTGIDNICCEQEEFDLERDLAFFRKEIKKELQQQIKKEGFKGLRLDGGKERLNLLKEDKEDPEGKVLSLKLLMEHKASDGSMEKFEPSLESDGTRRLMHLAPMLMEPREEQMVYVVDELDRSLHTLLSRKFLEAFLGAAKTGLSRKQLVFTTHDTNLLDRNLLRRDEIWFTEKDQAGSSHLTSLAEYKVADGLNYENGYLNGRFGAIPFTGDIRALMK